MGYEKKDSLGWALIGCGGAGNGHASGAASTPEIVLRGFCDVRADSASDFCARHGGAYHTTDPEEIFSDPEVDIVSIATSHQSHADLAVAAFEAGKHLYLEKPMAMNVEDCLRIRDAMNAAGTKLMINFSIRFSGAARAIKERLSTSRISHSQCMMAPADLSRWRWNSVEGGWPLYDVGVHALDFLCWIHEADPVEVYAVGGQVTHPGELDSPELVDSTAATIRFANGSVATFLMSDAGFSDVVSKWFFEFFDGKQSAVLYEHFRTVTFNSPKGEGGQPVKETLEPEPIARMPMLVAAIREDIDTYVGARAGIISTLMVQKVVESIHSGLPQKIEIPPGI